MKAIAPALIAAAASGIGSNRQSPVVPGVADLVLDERAIIQASEHRIEGLLRNALERGVVHATNDLQTRVDEAHLQVMRTCLAIEESAVQAYDALNATGMAVRVLKGVAMAHLDYPTPEQRVFGDVDLLIKRVDLPTALLALHKAGFRRALPAVRKGWEQRFAKAVLLIGPHGHELDLHLALAGGYFGEVFDHDQLWLRPGAPFLLAGRSMLALDRPDRLVHACMHAVLGGGSGLRVRRDIAQLVAGDEGNDTSNRDDDFQIARQRAIASGCDDVLAAGVLACWLDLGLDPEHPANVWARAHHSSPVQQVAIRHYQDVDHDWAQEARSTLSALNRGDRIRFVVGLAVPSRASLKTRQRSRVSHITRSLTALRQKRF